jgi:hypothetical protein
MDNDTLNGGGRFDNFKQRYSDFKDNYTPKWNEFKNNNSNRWNEFKDRSSNGWSNVKNKSSQNFNKAKNHFKNNKKNYMLSLILIIVILVSFLLLYLYWEDITGYFGKFFISSLTKSDGKANPEGFNFRGGYLDYDWQYLQKNADGSDNSENCLKGWNFYKKNGRLVAGNIESTTSLHDSNFKKWCAIEPPTEFSLNPNYEDLTTEFVNSDEGKVFKLDNHLIDCRNNDDPMPLNRIKLNIDENDPTNVNYLFNCISHDYDFNDLVYKSTPAVDAYKGNTLNLTAHDVNCDTNAVLASVQLNEEDAKLNYNYSCLPSFHKMDCSVKKTTPYTSYVDAKGNTSIYPLEKHDIKCDVNEAISQFKLVKNPDSTKNEYRYEYTCCKNYGVDKTKPLK